MTPVSSPAERDVASPPYGPPGHSPWLDVDWRQHQRWTIVNDSPINVIELGEGPPLLLLHGLSGSWPNWLEQIPVFAGRNGDSPRRGVSPGFGTRRVIAVDLPADLVDVEEYLVSGVPADRVHWVDTMLGPHLRYA